MVLVKATAESEARVMPNERLLTQVGAPPRETVVQSSIRSAA
jgi:hypothetical protein